MSLLLVSGVAWLTLSASVLGRLGVFTRPPLVHAPRREGSFLLSDVGMVIVVYFGVIFSISISFPHWFPKTDTTLTLSRLLLNAVAQLLGGLTVLGLASFRQREGLRGLGMHPLQLPMGAAVSLLATVLFLPWLLLANIGTEWVSRLIRHGPPPVHPALETLAGSHEPLFRALVVISACVIAPLAEELFFRGLLQTALLQGIKSAGRIRSEAAIRWTVILLVALFFTFMHIDFAKQNYEVIPPMMVLSLTLGYVYERTGNLWATIGIHAMFNTLSTLLFVSLSK